MKWAGKLGIILVGMMLTSFKANAACYDLSESEPHQLNGLLTSQVFPGPPNFEDVTKGDTPEPTFILRLFKPICLTGDAFADPKQFFWDVHLVASDPVSNKAARALVNSEVSVSIAQPMAAESGHHHAPLVAWIASIEKIQPGDSGDEFLSEYGTAATTVRAFYYALGNGDGKTASRYVIPEKRMAGSFSEARLTGFYSRLEEPLKLTGIRPLGPEDFLAYYTFKAGNRICAGRSVVTTVSRQGHNLIAKIDSLSGC